MWVEVLCWINRVWSSNQCACCACHPSVLLSVSSIGFVYVFVCRKLSPRLRVHMCLPSLCCFLGDYAYYVVGQEPAIAMHLALWYVVLVCHP